MQWADVMTLGLLSYLVTVLREARQREVPHRVADLAAAQRRVAADLHVGVGGQLLDRREAFRRADARERNRTPASGF